MDRNQIIMHLSDMAKLLAPKGTSVGLYGSQARGNACEELNVWFFKSPEYSVFL